MTKRAKLIEAIRQQPEVSVLVVGAGINGIGTFRDLAAQGLDVLLVDKGDFCSGASAASSHMLHGGLRYLENAEFRLVSEALYERNLMLKNAPHYAKPARTVIPIFSWVSGFLNAPLKFFGLLNKPSERGGIIIKIGLILYDWYARRQRVMPTHQVHRRAKSLELFPHLNPDIVATATYYDAWMPTPERICIDLLHDVEAANPRAKAINYMSLDKAVNGRVLLCDELTGETLEVKPKVVVNAAGPWIDFANASMQQTGKLIGGTKGSHLVVDHPELHQATQGSEMFFENKDGRIVLFFPLEDRVLMGTTDIPLDNPDEAVCTDEEVDYILGMVSQVFPAIKLDRSHIVFKFCGVRPLPASNVANAGQISRDHHIQITEPNNDIPFPVYSLVGGKWTTFRAFSEQTADMVLGRLGKSRKVSTEHMVIGGGKDYPADDDAKKRWLDDLAEETRLTPERAETLFHRYGTRAAEVAAFINSAPGDKALAHRADYSSREVLYIAQAENVVHLDDFVLRRSLLAMLGYLTRPLLDELAGIIGEGMGWSSEQQQTEVERSLEILRTKYGTEIR